MAAAINEYGDIVGFYTADGRTHGYLVSGGEFSTIDFPDASYTSAIGINPRGDIVGHYYGANRIDHGFLLTKENQNQD